MVVAWRSVWKRLHSQGSLRLPCCPTSLSSTTRHLQAAHVCLLIHSSQVRCLFIHCRSGWLIVAVSIESSLSKVTCTGCHFRDNRAQLDGAIVQVDGSTQLAHNTITHCSAKQGGAIAAQGGSIGASVLCSAIARFVNG